MMSGMIRTTIILPLVLKKKIGAQAKKKRVSFGEVVRVALEKFFIIEDEPLKSDAFLASQTIFDDAGATDVAARHDDYLYDRGLHNEKI